MRKSNRTGFSKKEKSKTLNNKAKQKLKKTAQAVSSLVVLGLAGYLYVNNPGFFQTRNENVSCRIGITTDLEKRKKDWTRDYLKEGIVIKNWTVLSVHQSKSAAQKAETREAKLQNCEAHPGGRNSNKKIWYVYKIEY